MKNRETNNTKEIKKAIKSEEKEKSELSKNSMLEKHELPKIPIKILEDYNMVTDHKKEKGTKIGAWFERKQPSEETPLSEGSEWLFKVGGGYSEEIDPVVISEMHAIKEAYAGAIYRLLMPELVSKTRLVIKKNLENADEKLKNYPRFSLASKAIKGFKDLTELTHEEIGMLRDLGPQVPKVIIIAILVAESDKGLENFGLNLQDKKFYKIDHGESLELIELRNGLEELSTLFNNTDNFFEKSFHIKLHSDKSVKLKQPLIKQALKECFLNYITPALEDIKIILKECRSNPELKKITDKYEKILSKYRDMSEMTHLLIGDKEGEIAKLFFARLDTAYKMCLDQIDILNKKESRLI